MTKHNTNFELVDIDLIQEGERFRQAHDIDADTELWGSIQSDGLMQPLGIDENNTLIWGGRRLRALRHLHTMANRAGHMGDPEEFRLVPVIRIDLGQRAENANEFGVVGSLHQVDPAAARELIKVQLEQQENALRRDFTDSEKHAIASRVEQLQAMSNKELQVENGRRSVMANADYDKRKAIKEKLQTSDLTQRTIAEQLECSAALVSHVKTAITNNDEAFFGEGDVHAELIKNKITPRERARSTAVAGESVGISATAYQQIRKTQEKGSSALVQARDENKVSRSAAAVIAELPPEQQAAIDYTNRNQVREAQEQGKTIIQARKDSGEESRGRKKLVLVEVKVKHTWVDADAYDEKLVLLQEEAKRVGSQLVDADPEFSTQLHGTLGELIPIE
ncbi:hypothetical protein VCRA2110O318_40053 [Vibrio crassostreae]|nr:hypothetical protein VCRA2117O328_40052 [Vibrio crassostreae]CAK2335259.1 hypothetical protein VCRA2110O318_40053 [Vibrio crassostreae]CAK2503666.1 hypothetical protein VCRA2110O319_50053 [Vibrio crassostreae]CAK2910389.1 hypothetical protein VCRA217O317_30240 [Vibrio crassostreae]